MKKLIILCAVLLVLDTAYCAQASRIELGDGSVIIGEIVSLADGVYTLKTAFGEVKIAEKNVSRIGPAENNLTPSQIEGYGQQLMSDPENAAIITGLAAGPEIQELAKDPQIADAVKAGDIQSLMKNEKFMSIVNSPQMQEISKKLKQ